MPSSPFIVHPGCGRLGSMHIADLLALEMTGFQSASLPDGIPLLQYADDMTFFIQGSTTAAQTLSIMMDIFSNFSGFD